MDTNLSAYEACFKKALYWSEADARSSAEMTWGKHGVVLDVYPCRIGNGGKHWHVGHYSASARRNRRLRTFGSQTLLTGR